MELTPTQKAILQAFWSDISNQEAFQKLIVISGAKAGVEIDITLLQKMFERMNDELSTETETEEE